MRSYLAGILLLCMASSAWGQQATGYVTALGFQSYYRPDCWTPLLVHLDTQLSTAEEYQVRIHQQDLDRDVVVYTRNVTLNPQGHQDYWTYFIPQPVGARADGGSLPSNPKELAEVLRVELYDKTGRNFITRLPVTFSANNLDPVSQIGYAHGRGHKLVLCVLEQDKPAWQEYTDPAMANANGALGLMEDVLFMPVSTRDLPDSVLGYEMVDSVLWLDANAQDIAQFGGKRLEALQQYVHKGGQLVVVQPPTEDRYAKILPLADMLPVVPMADKDRWAIEPKSLPDLSPLIELARTRMSGPPTASQTWDNWDVIEGSRSTWDMARAKPRPGTAVDQWIHWDKDNPDTDTPYLARCASGLGSVVWVAQDLGNLNLQRAPRNTKKPDPNDQVNSYGWAHVWDRVFGWRNETYTRDEMRGVTDENLKQRFAPGSLTDLGGALLRGTEHGARGTALTLLAAFFFIGYWVVAGPGSFVFLSARKRKGLSWIVFSMAALAATAVTVGVVKLVLRGSPEVRHISLVRLVPTTPAADGTPQFDADMDSRIGLYIPRDGDQRVAVTHTTAGRVSSLTPLAIHPQFMPENKEGFLDQAKYVVDTDQFVSGKDVTVDVPYRSTLKKLQARWTGTVQEGILGSAKIIEVQDVLDPKSQKKVGSTGPITGKLVNKTGHDLVHVYFAFRPGGIADPAQEGRPSEQVLYVPVWNKDGALDLDAEMQQAKNLMPGWVGTRVEPPAERVPPSGTPDVRGLINPNTIGWPVFWYGRVGPGVAEVRFDDSDNGFVRSFPMMALFDVIGPDRADPSRSRNERWDLLRRGGREMNVSQLLESGQLVILAQAVDSAIPVPLTVEGDKMDGEGTTLYEIAMPLDRSALVAPPKPPATKPAASQPASRPAGRGEGVKE